MDPMTYLRLVNTESINLPDVFISSSLSTHDFQQKSKKKKVRKQSLSFPLPLMSSVVAFQYLFDKYSLLLSPPSDKYLPKMNNVTNDGGMNRKG